MFPKIAVFGASGFIGGHLVNKLRLDGYNVIGVQRGSKVIKDAHNLALDSHNEENVVRFLNDAGITHIINTIGKAHDLRKTSEQDELMYMRANVDLTDKIAAAAKFSKVSKLILLSSSKIYGNLVSSENPSEHKVGRNLNTYGKTKYEGEKALLQRLKGSKIRPIIIRMPLVYGKNVKGNLMSLKNAIARGLPLPFKNITANRRSMLSISNLYSFLLMVLFSDKIEGYIFNLKDREDYSTAQIINNIMLANDINGKIFGINDKILTVLLNSFSAQLAEKITGNDTINDSFARAKLSWEPKGPNLEDFRL